MEVYFEVKKILFLIFGLVLCFSLVGCGGEADKDRDRDNGSRGETSTTSTPVLEIVESGYTLPTGSSNYANFGFILRNPDTKTGVEFPTVRITAKAADGSIIASDEQVLSIIRPEESLAYASSINTKGQDVDIIVFEALKPKDYNLIAVSKLTPQNYKPLKVEGLREYKDTYRTTYTGEVLNENDSALSGVSVTIILRSNDGKIVGGETTYLDEVEASGKIPFDTLGLSNATYATYEAYACEWGSWKR
jgi:hypothetical protein